MQGSGRRDAVFERSQLNKGTLEGCILKIIGREPSYGYAIVAALREAGFADVTEGTLYPLLLRLERKGMLNAAYQASPIGFASPVHEGMLTELGAQYLAEFEQAWRTTAAAVEAILQE